MDEKARISLRSIQATGPLDRNIYPRYTVLALLTEGRLRRRSRAEQAEATKTGDLVFALGAETGLLEIRYRPCGARGRGLASRVARAVPGTRPGAI
jgi:hypothetical protein